MNDETYFDDSEENDDGDEEFTLLANSTTLWKRSDRLDARRKLERIFELRRLKEFDEDIAWEDLD